MNTAQLLKALASAGAVPPREVVVPGVGKVFVRPVTVAENSAKAPTEEAATGSHEQLARAACRVLCDNKGARVLDENNKEHLALFSALPWAALSAVLDAAKIADEEAAPKGN